MLAGVGAKCVLTQLRQRQTARGSMLMAGYGQRHYCHLCFSWQPSVLLGVAKQQFEQASGRSRDKREAGSALASGGVSGWW